MSARVLVVEDTDVVRGFLVACLSSEGHAVSAVPDGESALRALAASAFDVVICDVRLPRTSGLSVLSAAATIQPAARFVMLSGYADVDSAVEAMKLGAVDYLTKPVDQERLLRLVDRTVDAVRARGAVAAPPTDAVGHLVGRSPAIAQLASLIRRVAATRAPVLVTGETGTGKELIARAIHASSDRAAGPFVPVHCAALPESLIERELFGHVKGAFTGATESRRGLFEAAHGGTVFLDEIATIPMATQIRLLRVLQERSIQRVGADAEVPVDFRVVAATNVDLAGEVASGRFRQDLYYRLNVFPIQSPPLRERREDVPVLVEHFCARFAEELGVVLPPRDASSVEALAAHDWPGNVRELEHFVQRTLILHAGATVVRFSSPAIGAAAEPARDLLIEQARAEHWDLERVEREYIERTLRETGNNQVRAAELLGIDRKTLHRKIKKYAAA